MTTWTPKVRKMIACWSFAKGFGPWFDVALGSNTSFILGFWHFNGLCLGVRPCKSLSSPSPKVRDCLRLAGHGRVVSWISCVVCLRAQLLCNQNFGFLYRELLFWFWPSILRLRPWTRWVRCLKKRKRL